MAGLSGGGSEESQEGSSGSRAAQHRPRLRLSSPAKARPDIFAHCGVWEAGRRDAKQSHCLDQNNKR